MASASSHPLAKVTPTVQFLTRYVAATHLPVGESVHIPSLCDFFSLIFFVLS